jgi:hypothetical protein
MAHAEGADPAWAAVHERLADLGVSIDRVVAERDTLRKQNTTLLAALKEAFDSWFEKPRNIERIEPAWVVNARAAIEAAS